nr:ribonuclease H-like domain-containing protein [Tanacetum cinerariifolium]
MKAGIVEKELLCEWGGTGFKSQQLHFFAEQVKGINRKFSVPRTPQQNGIAERKNRTLIEAARTLLADSLLLIPFWAEAVNTACYLQNRVLVTKRHNKTPYELLHGRLPSTGFMRHFGCPVTILNTLDPLGKFQGKVDEGFLIGYSVCSKAFRVFNSRTHFVQETVHVNFMENKPNVTGPGPAWLFDIDSLSQTMNYHPVIIENQSNPNAGIAHLVPQLVFSSVFLSLLTVTALTLPGFATLPVFISVSSVAYQGPTIPTPFKVVKQGTEVTKDQVQTPSSLSTAPVQPSIAQSETQTPVSKPVVALVSALMPNLKPSIPYPSRRDNERRRDQANEQIEKFYEIFKDMSFEISFTDALILMPKFASTLKALIGNKEKLSEMARTPMKEHCSEVILNKFPRKLGDPGKFLIPSLLLMELTPTCMTLELADRSVSKPIGIAKDVSVKVGVFHFLADFVVVDFEPEPRVLLIIGRCFLKTGRALIDVYKGELTLRIGNKSITYNLDQTARYSANYNQMTANKINVIDLACEEYSQEVISSSDVATSGNPTPHDDPIVSIMSHTLTPFGDSDFLLFEEADAFLDLEDNSNSPKINSFYYDLKGDILFGSYSE